MLGTTITADTKGFKKFIDNLGKSQVPFAASKTINQLAKEIVAEESKEMETVFDNPTRFTTNSMFVSKFSNKREYPNLQAQVRFREFPGKGVAAENYLRSQLTGKPRKQKRSEAALARKGIIKSSEYLVPARNARKNKHGNITRGKYNKMLSAFGAQRDESQNSASGKRPYFLGKTKNGGKVIYERIGKGRRVRPFLFVTNSADYDITFRPKDVSQRHVRKNYKRRFERNFREALATRR